MTAHTSVNTAPSLLSQVPAKSRLLLRLLDKLQFGRLHLIGPDGHGHWFGHESQPVVEITLHDWRVLDRIIRNGDIGLAEAYRQGQVEVSDLTGLMRLALQNQQVLERAIHGHWLGRLLYRLRHLLNANTRAGSRRNIHAHYDIGNDFYRLWLDPSMTYSSAWFDGDLKQSLQQAQQAKYQRILDQLDARPGETVLEIGCGWGGFAQLAAERGLKVKGITLSTEQLDYARQRMAAAGLSDSVELSLTDYRDLTGQFDHIVSIEMLEAVGERWWPGYFQQVARCLKPGGRAVIQTITIADERFEQYRRGTDFIQQYIFPGGMLPCDRVLRQQAASAGLDLQQNTTFGIDYAETLLRWRESFEAVLPQVRQQGFDEAFIRLWRFYLCYCEAAFRESATDVVQLCLQKPQH